MIIFRQIDNVWNHSRVFCCCSVVAVMLMLLQNITRGQYPCRCCVAPPAGTLVSDAEDVGSVSGDGDMGAITKSSIQGPRCPPQHCPAPASAEVCCDDGNMEVDEMETSQQQHLILVIQSL